MISEINRVRPRDQEILFFHDNKHLLPACKDCGHAPDIREHHYQGIKYYITSYLNPSQR